MRIATFSLVARDPESGALGVAVASKFLAVGAVVPHARAGVGAVATQSYANPTFGPRGLAILEAGGSPEAVREAFLRTDPEIHLRQFGVVDQSGASATFTGEGCHGWAGGVAGENFAAQGNLLAGPEVVEALVETFRARDDLPFPERLLAALHAADQAGGDRRGRQSAALLVVAEGRGYGGLSDRWIDLRVDDHPDPVPELARLLEIHRLFFEPAGEPEPLSEADLAWLAELLVQTGDLAEPEPGWSPRLEAALKALLGRENLEMRYRGGPVLEPEVLAYLKRRYA